MTDIRCTALGRLVRDPEVRFSQDGKAVVKFTIVHSDKYKDTENVTYLDTVLFGKSGEAFERFHKKGAMVYVEGSLQQDSWSDKETGKPRSKMVLKGRGWSFTGSKGDNPSPGNQQDEETGGLVSYQINDDSRAGDQADLDVPF
jgi:single-strand DNA-binding protein